MINRAISSALGPSVRTRLARLMIELEAFEQLELSGFSAGPVWLGDQALPSMPKLTGSALHQRVAELALVVAGPQASSTIEAIGLTGAELDVWAKATAKHLCVRAATIYSGNSETQRNVIAHQLLAGLQPLSIDH